MLIPNKHVYANSNPSTSTFGRLATDFEETWCYFICYLSRSSFAFLFSISIMSISIIKLLWTACWAHDWSHADALGTYILGNEIDVRAASSPPVRQGDQTKGGADFGWGQGVVKRVIFLVNNASFACTSKWWFGAVSGNEQWLSFRKQDCNGNGVRLEN